MRANFNTWLLFLALAVVLPIGIQIGSAQPTTGAMKWEYKVLDVGHVHSESEKEWTKKLNDQSGNGWEVVQVVFPPNNPTLYAVLRHHKN